jgi:cobalt-zinc-cadmium efflux system outer membrane protein
MLRAACIFKALIIAGSACAQAPLTLEEARKLALERQPALQALQLSERAMLAQSTADAGLPDPRLKLGALNFPTRGFPSARDDMTQLAITYEQMVPGGDKRRLRAEKTRAEAAQMRAERAVLANAIRRDVSLAWLTSWGLARTEVLVRELQAEYRQAIDAATVSVAAGRGSQADVYIARQLVNQSEDRLLELAMQSERARAELGRWIGQALAPRVAESLPAMDAPAPLAELLERLESHPQHAMSRAAENTAQAEVSLAREASSPDRSWEVGYMFRDGDRSDMVMFQFAFELPFWRESRQDRVVESKLRMQERAREQSEDHLRMLRADLQAAYSEWQRNGERLANFDARILPDAQARIDALSAAYRAGRAELGAVLEARRTLTDSRIQRFAVEVARAKARANIAYYFEHPE